MKTAASYCAEPADVHVSSMAELPAVRGYDLPNWGHVFRYRATAWAYLTRSDGGPFVLLNGRKYFRRATK